MADINGTFGNDNLVGTTYNDNLYGGAGNDLLWGKAGNDILDGGSGIDSLLGGLGNDIYIVDSATDILTENYNEGMDTVNSSVSFTLSANLENLTLTGSSTINGMGNALSNTITGNTANNLLFGGDGNDVLYGKAGNDKLAGGDGNDKLTGGAGTDTLTGGAGADTFIFNLPTDGIDIITDLACLGGDKIQISASGFGIGLGQFSRFTYDSSTGALFFDQTQFASLHPTSSFLPSLDISII